MEQLASQTDEQLLHVFSRGRDDAFEALVCRHGTGIKAYAQRLLRNPELAEDVYVETFARLVRERDNLRPQGTVRGFLYTIAHNLCISLLRRRKTEREAAPQLMVIENGRGAQPGADAMASAAQVAQRLEQGIASLSYEHRQVLLLRTVHGLSSRETADVVGLDESQVRSQLSWARKCLRLFLAHGRPARAVAGSGGQE